MILADAKPILFGQILIRLTRLCGFLFLLLWSNKFCRLKYRRNQHFLIFQTSLKFLIQLTIYLECYNSRLLVHVFVVAIKPVKINALLLFSLSLKNHKSQKNLDTGTTKQKYKWTNGKKNQRTIGPVLLIWVWGYAELEQTWKYKSTQCSISCHSYRSIRNQEQIWPCHKNG